MGQPFLVSLLHLGMEKCCEVRYDTSKQSVQISAETTGSNKILQQREKMTLQKRPYTFLRIKNNTALLVNRR